MKTGWLIVNGFLESSKFEEIYEWLIKAAHKKNILLKKITNDRLTATMRTSGKTSWKRKPDFVLFWDKDIKLAKMLEKEGFLLFNKASAIEICDDKALTFIALKNTDILMPKTYIAPLHFDREYKDYAFVIQVGKDLGYPMIIKENKGSFGMQVYCAKDFESAVNIIKKIGHYEFIMQEYIESSAGRDIRIHVVGNKIITAMKRINPHDFRANITNGGTMEPYIPSEDEKKMALSVCRTLNLDFAGVDILFGQDQKPVLCEVNSNAHFKNIYDCTGVDVASEMIDYILSRI